MPILEDAAPMAAAAQLGQAVMEFDPSATVETVVIDAETQSTSEIEEEITEVIIEETTIEVTEELSEEASEETAEELTPESEDNPDETK